MSSVSSDAPTPRSRLEIAELRQAQQQLRESEARYRSIVESAFDAIITIDHRSLITEFNPAAEAIFGWKRNEVIGRDLVDTLIPARVRPGYRRRLERQSDFDAVPQPGVRLELPALRADGSELPVELTVSRVAGSAPPNFTAIIRDLTERVRAEIEARSLAEQLKASELQYRSLFVHNPQPMWVYDPQTLLFLAANEAAMVQYGYSQAEFMTMTVDALRPADERQAWRQALLSRPLHGPQRYSVRHSRKEGETVYVDSVSNDIVFEGRTARVVLALDITEQRRSVQALGESQRALAALMSNLPGMAYRCRNDPSWSIVFVSQGAYLLTGHRPEALMAGNVAYAGLIHPDDRDRVWDEVQQAIARDWPFELTYRISTAEGSQKWVWERGSAVRGPAGEVVAVEGFVSDITERRQAQEEVARLNSGLEERVRRRTAQLEAANAELEAFSYSIAHDLRSPLTSIDGFSHVLEQLAVPTVGEQGRHYLRRIRAGVRQMSDLTDAMLSLARLSRVKLRWEPVDLAAIARDIEANLRENEPQRAATVEIPDRLDAHGDPRLLTQVLTNLLGNAWKFSAGKPQTFIRIGSAPGETGEPVYFVADQGAGFDMAHASRLFGAFHRVHSPTEFEGTGIGLALVQKIIFRHAGRIWADARPGDGATFYFTLSSVPPA